MGEHYFSRTPASLHEVHAFTHAIAGRTLSFETDAGVFSKGHMDKGTALLLSALPEVFSGRALDLGCGWGAVGVCMKAMWPGAEVLLTDVNERAAGLAAANLKRNGLDATVLCGDGLSHVPGQFDLIATNPPIRAGKAVVYRLFEESIAHLAPGGVLYVVIRKQQGADSAHAFLRDRLAEVAVVERGAGFRVLRGVAR